MLGFGGMQNTPSLLLHPGSLWHRMIVPDRIQSMGYIEVNCIFMLN